MRGGSEDDGGTARTGISVVVPSYNHGRYVERCLRSIFAQRTRPDELVVIDDGSTDGSVPIIEKVLEDSPCRATLVSRENRGLSATLNEGLRATSGDFFAYLGSDDVWLPEFLGSAADALRSRPQAVLAYAHCLTIDEAGRVVASTRGRVPYVDGAATKMLLEGVAPQSAAVLHRRSAVEAHGWNEQSALEDYELYLRLSRDGEFALLDVPLGAWRRHASNTSRQLDAMLEARQNAIADVGPLLGLDHRSLRKTAARITWLSAESYISAGQRRRAVAMSATALSAAPGAGAVLRRAAHLTLPLAVFKRRGAWLEKRAARRYADVRGT